ncbi:MAG: DMT family protein [Opitutia bacterium]
MRPEILKPALLTIGLLCASNLFMTFAWYGHLRTMKHSPWWTAALLSWGIALAEYLLMVPANRIGYEGGLSGAQLKVIQECVTLVIFVPFMMLFLGEKWRWDFLWAFFCILGAVFFIFRPDRA